MATIVAVKPTTIESMFTDPTVMRAEITRVSKKHGYKIVHKIWREHYGYFLEVLFANRNWPIISYRARTLQELEKYIPAKVLQSKAWIDYHD